MTCEDNSRSRLVTGWSRVGSGLFPFISIGAFLAGHGWSRVGHGSVRVFSLSFQLGRFLQVTVGHGLVTGRFGSFPFHFNWGVSHRSRLVTGWSRGPGLIFKQNMLQTVLSMYFGLFAKVHEVHEWNGTKTKTM